MMCCLGSLAWDVLVGIFVLGFGTWDLLLGIVGLGFWVYDMLLLIFKLEPQDGAPRRHLGYHMERHQGHLGGLWGASVIHQGAPCSQRHLGANNMCQKSSDLLSEVTKAMTLRRRDERKRRLH